jgi:putative restriction endonuclease
LSSRFQNASALALDEQIRFRAFEWLKEQETIHGDVLPRTLLADGFEFKGARIPLIGPQGIFKPRDLELPLSITTAPSGPYNDTFDSDNLLLYRYRGTDPHHRENVGLRQAMLRGTPLIDFHGLVPGRYMASWPVFIVGDNPASLSFKVAVDDVTSTKMGLGQAVLAGVQEIRRAYITSVVRQRLHQRAFRERVIRAYHEQCALCRLRHFQLLDAAHIIPDRDPAGEPRISNGISLCKLHHAAFDASIIGITPDYIVEIRKDILEESDGPMLQHGLKELHKGTIILPRDKQSWPDREGLDQRYQQFVLAS